MAITNPETLSTFRQMTSLSDRTMRQRSRDSTCGARRPWWRRSRRQTLGATTTSVLLEPAVAFPVWRMTSPSPGRTCWLDRRKMTVWLRLLCIRYREYWVARLFLCCCQWSARLRLSTRHTLRHHTAVSWRLAVMTCSSQRHASPAPSITATPSDDWSIGAQTPPSSSSLLCLSATVNHLIDKRLIR